MKVLELGHVNLWVSSVERSSAFYRDTLGFAEVARGALRGRQVAFFSLGERHHDLALVEVGGPAAPFGPRQPGLNHIGLKVGDSLDDLRRMRDVLVALGTVPHHYVQHCVCQSMHVLDPDGNTIELYVDADPGVWAHSPEAIVCSDPFDLD